MNEPIYFINIADIPDEDGKTPRQKNLANPHNIPLQSLVETSEGLRLWVVDHRRDCDGTPLYGLSFDIDWHSSMYGLQNQAMAMSRVDGGYPEESLTVISSPQENSNL